jgi:phospholipase C
MPGTMGKYDRWLESKESGHEEYAPMPLTMGYYTRADIPFYYSLADAFTICDQHFLLSSTYGYNSKPFVLLVRGQ